MQKASLGIHGAFLLASGKVQNAVTWETDCVTEDYWFLLGVSITTQNSNEKVSQYTNIKLGYEEGISNRMGPCYSQRTLSGDHPRLRETTATLV